MFKEHQLRRTPQYFEAYKLLQGRIEQRGEDLNDYVYMLTDSIRERIYKEAGLDDDSYILIPGYIHIYFDKKDREVLEINCLFESDRIGGNIIPSSARAGVDMYTEDILYTEVSYEENEKILTSY